MMDLLRSAHGLIASRLFLKMRFIYRIARLKLPGENILNWLFQRSLPLLIIIHTLKECEYASYVVYLLSLPDFQLLSQSCGPSWHSMHARLVEI